MGQGSWGMGFGLGLNLEGVEFGGGLSLGGW